MPGLFIKHIRPNYKPLEIQGASSGLLGRFAPSFYLNFEYVLYVYILKQRRKKFCGFKKKFADFQEFFFYKIKNL